MTPVSLLFIPNNKHQTIMAEISKVSIPHYFQERKKKYTRKKNF
jgi:hypothetical protein